MQPDVCQSTAVTQVTANVADQDHVDNTAKQLLSLTGPMAIQGCAASYGHVMRSMGEVAFTGYCDPLTSPTCLVMLMHKPFIPRPGRNKHYSDYKTFVA